MYRFQGYEAFEARRPGTGLQWKLNVCINMTEPETWQLKYVENTSQRHPGGCIHTERDRKRRVPPLDRAHRGGTSRSHLMDWVDAGRRAAGPTGGRKLFLNNIGNRREGCVGGNGITKSGWMEGRRSERADRWRTIWGGRGQNAASVESELLHSSSLMKEAICSKAHNRCLNQDTVSAAGCTDTTANVLHESNFKVPDLNSVDWVQKAFVR